MGCRAMSKRIPAPQSWSKSVGMADDGRVNRLKTSEDGATKVVELQRRNAELVSENRKLRLENAQLCGRLLEGDHEIVSLPKYVALAARHGNFRTVLQWLNKGNVEERVNAKCEDGGNASLLLSAALGEHHDLMSHLLLNGADVNILHSEGGSAMCAVCCDDDNHSQVALKLGCRTLLGWGTNDRGNDA